MTGFAAASGPKTSNPSPPRPLKEPLGQVSNQRKTKGQRTKEFKKDSFRKKEEGPNPGSNRGPRAVNALGEP